MLHTSKLTKTKEILKDSLIKIIILENETLNKTNHFLIQGKYFPNDLKNTEFFETQKNLTPQELTSFLFQKHPFGFRSIKSSFYNPLIGYKAIPISQKSLKILKQSPFETYKI